MYEFNEWCVYHLLTESDVITGKSQTEDYNNTSRPRLISYLLYGLSSAILKKNTIKTPEVIFPIRLGALWLSSSLILKKYLYASFSFSYLKYSCTLSSFLLFSPTRSQLLLTTQKSRGAEKKFDNAWSLLSSY